MKIERKFFLWIIGSVILMTVISITVVYVCMCNEIKDDYASKAKNIGHQLGYNMECQLQSIEERIKAFGGSSVRKTNSDIYSDFRKISSSEICILSISFERSADLLNYGKDNISSETFIKKESLDELKPCEGVWILMADTASNSDHTVGYVYKCSDGAVITANIDINRIIKIIDESNFLKNAEVLLGSKENKILLKGNGEHLHKAERNIVRSTYFQRSSNLWVEYYLAIPIMRILMPWYLIVIVMSILLLCVSVYVVRRYAKGISGSLSNLDKKIFEYINKKRGGRPQ